MTVPVLNCWDCGAPATRGKHNANLQAVFGNPSPMAASPSTTLVEILCKLIHMVPGRLADSSSVLHKESA
jgi:hypothetical protein